MTHPQRLRTPRLVNVMTSDSGETVRIMLTLRRSLGHDDTQPNPDLDPGVRRRLLFWLLSREQREALASQGLFL